MSGETKQYLINKRLMPEYYPEFHCLMGACRQSCCQGWNIDFSKRDYLDIKQAARGTPLAERAQAGMVRLRHENGGADKYARFRLDETGRCPMLNEDGLCSLQLTCGEGVLPEVCRTFPRAQVYSPAGCEERSCSTGCEAVLSQLYRLRDGLGFIEEPIPPGEERVAELSLQEALAQQFSPLRELCIDMLQDRRAPLARRLILLGLVLRDLDGRVQAGDTGTLGGWLAGWRARVEAPGALSATAELPGNKPMFLLSNLKRLILTRPPTESFLRRRAWILEQFQIRQSEGAEQTQANLGYYLAAERELEERFGDLEYFFENIMVNTAFYTKFPLTANSEEIWKNYVSFCAAYSFFRFFTVSSRPADEEELIDTLTLASRALLHNLRMSNQMTDKLIENESDTLAHMAILALG